MKTLLIDECDRTRQFITITLEQALGELDLIEVTNLKDATLILASEPFFELIIIKTQIFNEKLQEFIASSANTDVLAYGNCDQLDKYPNINIIKEFYQMDASHFAKTLLEQPPIKRKLSKMRPQNGDLTTEKAQNSDKKHHYKKVRLFFFWRFAKLNFPVYIRLNEDKFIKVLNKDESYGPDFVEKYQHKDLTHLYIAQENFDEFSTMIYEKPLFELAPDLDNEQRDLRTNQFIVQMAQTIGITPNLLEVAKKSIDSVIDTVKSKKSLSRLLNILDNSGGYNSMHATLLGYISTIVCDELNWSARRSKEKLAMAALFHDIGLRDQNLARLDYKTMHTYDAWDKNKKNKYLNHSLRASELVLETIHSYPQVDTIILQHHERPDGSGFPYGKDYNSLTPLSSLFIVCHDFLNRLFEQDLENLNYKKIFEEIEPFYTQSHFLKCIEVLKSIFNDSEN